MATFAHCVDDPDPPTSIQLAFISGTIPDCLDPRSVS